jgi:hypothetical protein
MARTSKKAAANATATAANLPAIVPGAATASALPANGQPAPLPAANNGAAWLALLAAVPGVGNGQPRKYGATAGLLPCANNMFNLTAWGATAAAAGGKGPKGNYTVMALVAAATAAAQAALGLPASAPVCGAAIAYFMVTTPAITGPMQPRGVAGGACKTNYYVGKCPQGTGALQLPCMGWLSGYILGAARLPAGLLNKQ